MVSACKFKNEINSNYYCQKLNLVCAKDNEVIFFKTSKGNFEVELFGKDNPVTVSNFLKNITNNVYLNRKFYKIIDYSQIKFIHGGVNPEDKSYTGKHLIFNKIVLQNII